MKLPMLPLAALMLVLTAWPAAAQFKLPKIPGVGSVTDTADKIGSLVITDEEEAQIGAQISADLRKHYGVVQDPAVHRYVTLVGQLLARSSSRPNLPWTFIVLDTDGVNAFAAPGGYVHVTRGALGLIHSEAELAGVLAHEITHVTNKHALAEIRRAQGARLAAAQTRSDLLATVADAGLTIVKGNLWGKPQELESDRVGATLANGVGYSPVGLGTFLTELMERNAAVRDAKEKDRTKGRNGLFSTHPEIQERISTLNKVIAAQQLAAAAVVSPRYATNVSYQAIPIDTLAGRMAQTSAAAPAAGAAPAAAGPAASTGRQPTSILARGLGALETPTAVLSNDQQASVAYARNVDVEQDAPGGPNPAPVPVTVTPEEITQFRSGVSASFNAP